MRPRARHGALALALAVVPAAHACRSPASDPDAELAALRLEVAKLRARVSDAPPGEALPESPDTAGVVLGLRTSMVQDVLAEAARRYLEDVRLHVRPNVVVREGDDVRLKMGPVEVRAGRWEVAVDIRRVDARLSADSLLLSVGDSARLDVTVPVHVSEATGDVMLEFRWDAEAAAGVVCGDFHVREAFTGVVEPRTIRVRGYFALENGPGGTVARPMVAHRIPVSPEPTPEGWRRVRAILEEQDRLSNCGLVISAERAEARLRKLLERGFTFPLPSSILRPMPLPAHLADEVEVGGRRVAIEVRPRPPVLTEAWLWFGADVAAARTEERRADDR